GIGEVDGFLALVGDADAGDGEVEGSGLEAGDDSVEVRHLLLEFESGIVGDGGDEIDVEAGVLAVLLELEGNEGRVGGVGVAVLELSLGVSFAARAARQARGHRNGGYNGDPGQQSFSVLHFDLANKIFRIFTCNAHYESCHRESKSAAQIVRIPPLMLFANSIGRMGFV